MNLAFERVRGWMAGRSLRLFSAPYLPTRLIVAALLLAYTDLVVILLGQPAGYWMDRSRAVSMLPVLQWLLGKGILLYALAGLLYMALLWWLLTVLTRSLALVVWMPFSFVHLAHSLSWAAGRFGLPEPLDWSSAFIVGVDAAAALTLGVVLVRGLMHEAQTVSASHLARLWRATPAVWLLIGVALVLASAALPRAGWARLHPVHSPGRRILSAVAYDPARKGVLLFGGISSGGIHESDTWEWNGKDWTELKPKTTPPARAGHTMAYDEKRGVVVMFGGEGRDGKSMLWDTWEWDGKDWKMLPQLAPQGRRGAQMFYDPQSEAVILSGGFSYDASTKTSTPLSDAWSWNGKEWRYLESVAQSLAITNPNVAYDPLRGRTLLYDYSRVMTWSEGQWKELETSNNPPQRLGPWLAADPNTGSMLLFGGIENQVQLNDTWLLQEERWMQLHPDLEPGPRDAYVMFYDPARKSFILYGGIHGSILDDMWELVLP